MVLKFSIELLKYLSSAKKSKHDNLLKDFQNRESLLAQIFKKKEANCIKSIVLAIYIVVLLEMIVTDISQYGR